MERSPKFDAYYSFRHPSHRDASYTTTTRATRGEKSDQPDHGAFDDISLSDHAVEARSNGEYHGPKRGKWRKYLTAMTWWHNEFFYTILCLAVSACLVILLQNYDSKVVPTLVWNIQLDTVIIAMMTAVRLSLKGIAESAISQTAWTWVSEARQMRQKDTDKARLEDFKYFDEASRGL